MARPIRVEFEGAVYHVIARGNERREIFRSGRDQGLFLETLEEAVLRAHVVDAGEYGMQLVRYNIHLSRVRSRRKDEPIPAGRAAELDAYPWSSHRACAGLAGKPG